MSYRGYELEQKTLMVGWQITITRDGKFVRNGNVAKELGVAVEPLRSPLGTPGENNAGLLGYLRSIAKNN